MSLDQTDEGNFVMQGEIKDLRALAENVVGHYISTRAPGYLCIPGIAARYEPLDEEECKNTMRCQHSLDFFRLFAHILILKIEFSKL